MADTKISALTAVTVPADTDEFAVNQGGTSKKVTGSQLKEYAKAKSFIRADVDRTLASSTALQAVFNSPTNGRLTLTTGVYIFEGQYIVTAMSATTGNAMIDILGAGTATIASWMWYLHGLDNSTPNAIVADLHAWYQVGVTAASCVTAGTGTALRVKFKGSFDCTSAGTLIPSIDLVTAASAVVQDGSFFECERIGNANMTSLGAWD